MKDEMTLLKFVAVVSVTWFLFMAAITMAVIRQHHLDFRAYLNTVVDCERGNHEKAGPSY